ncbi:DUF58 domain-containing protein [Salinarchaeum laminariae]|uniref:DUF58 domain-containing protein n=1 Tax=Salinarchaeum laminariae TaxID=869888 RepID=UPI0020BFF558|nr:DUF58 domain-containing protein [Salinarchaeum laminariae]
MAEFEASATTEIHVRSREPDTTHLGQGDDRIAVFGEHNTGRRGPGTEPAELRPYNPGDDFSQIDWNATARLRDAYVTESDAETDRRTVLFVDHRSTAEEGPPGSTPLAYLRYAGLALVESARNLGDPLGCYAIGDEGVTVEHPPSNSPGQYDTVAESIQSLRPTEKHSTEDARGSPATSRSQEPASPPSEGPSGSISESTDGGYSTDSAVNATAGIGRPANISSDPARAAEFAGRLSTEDSPFANHLNPLLDDATPYLHRVADEPLFQAARTYLERLQGSVWSVILTDGEHPGELRETVKLARRGNNTVLVVLASPTLFRPGLTDLDERRQTYEELVEFANSLTAMDRVTVRELAPGDIAEAVLSAGGEQT